MAPRATPPPETEQQRHSPANPQRSEGERRWISGVFALLGVVGFLTILPRVGSWNDGSRMALIQSLVEFHSLSIDQSVFATTGMHDKVYIGGHFYSDKLATPSLVGAMVYYPLYLLGVKLHSGANLAYFLITLATVKLAWFASLVAFFRVLGLTGLSGRRRSWLVLALGLGSLHLTWSATFNNHSLAASWLMVAFACVAFARRGGGAKRLLTVAGLMLGLASTSDMPTVAFFAAFLVLVLIDPALRPGVAWYAGAFVLATIPALYVNYRISGSLVPVQLVPEYFMYEGSPWAENELTGAGVNRGQFLLNYSFDMLLGDRGFLRYNPLLLLAVPLLVREAVRRRPFAPEAVAVSAAGAAMILYYLLFSNNLGGWSYSIRWWVPLLPVTYFFLYPWLEHRSRIKAGVFGALLASSAVFAFVGVLDPWTNVDRNPSPFLSNLMDYRHLLLARFR